MVSNLITTDNGPGTPEVPNKKVKDGGFFARPHIRTDLGQATAVEVPARMPEDFVQIELLDLGNGDEAGPIPVYIVPVTHPSTNERSNYVVRPEVVDQATSLWDQGDAIFAVLTEKSLGYGGEARVYELYPWISRTGQFGVWPIVTPLPGNSHSEHAYNSKSGTIRANVDQWVRYTNVNKDLQAVTAPFNVTWPTKWPAEYLNGDWESIINRAYRGQIIRSLEDQAAKWLAGLI